TIVGDYVTVGHKVILHGCVIGNYVLVGMGAIIMDGAQIEDFVLVGAGALVTPGKKFPSGVLVAGFPAKVVRDLKEEEIKPERFINGHDLIALGLKPGPPFSKILNHLYDEQLEGKLQTREEALARAKKLVAEVLGSKTKK
ncbi:MAG: hypothetical protein ACK4WF_06945, partial [Candidatus Brocadiales bacterium]